MRAFEKVYSINKRMTRPICNACEHFPSAINYKRNGKTYFRTRCAVCINKGKTQKIPVARWRLAGYLKKKSCDLCGFKSKHGSQIRVYHIDGNLNNNDTLNLRSVCLNCTAIIQRQETGWLPGDFEPDR